VLAALSASFQPRRRILHRLETLELGVGYAVQQRVEVVEAVADERVADERVDQ